MGAHQRIGGRLLQKGASLVVDLRAEKIVGRCITNLELDRWIELDYLDEIRRPKIPGLGRWCRGERLRAELGDRPHRRDPELVGPRFRLDVSSREAYAGRECIGCPARAVTPEDDPLAVVQPTRWKGECVAGNLGE